MAGKGSRPRPIKDRKQFEENWDKIFNKKQPQMQQPDVPNCEDIKAHKEQATDPRNG